MYASPDEGITWTPLHDPSWPVLYVWDIEIDPNNSNVVLLATEAGLFRTDDGGISWHFGIGNTGSMTVRSVRCSPNSSGLILAGEETLGILRSEDGGFSFEVSSTGINELDVTSTTANPLNPLELALAFQGLNSGGIFSSKDGGVSWLRENCPPTRYFKAIFSPFGILHAISSGPTTVAAEGVYRRDTDGTWVHLGPNQGSLFDTDLRSLRFSTKDPRLIFTTGKDAWSAGDEAAIWRSNDGGDSWTRAYESEQTYQTVTDIEIIEDGTDMVIIASWVAPSSPSGGILRSINGGHTWVEPFQGLPSDTIPSNLSPSPRGTDVFFLSDSSDRGGLFQTEDAGETWTSTEFRGVPVWDVIAHPANVNTVYITSGSAPFVAVSEDGGVSFTPFSEGLEEAGYQMEIGLSSDVPPRLLLSTMDGSFIRSLGHPSPRRPSGRVSP